MFLHLTCSARWPTRSVPHHHKLRVLPPVKDSPVGSDCCALRLSTSLSLQRVSLFELSNDRPQIGFYRVRFSLYLAESHSQRLRSHDPKHRTCPPPALCSECLCMYVDLASRDSHHSGRHGIDLRANSSLTVREMLSRCQYVFF